MQGRILFYRSFKGYTGGHGKVWNYFNHILQGSLLEPFIYFSEDSILDETNPWLSVPDRILSQWRPIEANLLFLAGMDWERIPSGLNNKIPVVNLIQGLHHADPNSPLFGYLENKAIRICVSKAVAQAIMGTGKVNGPVYVIPCGVDISSQLIRNNRNDSVFIDATKNTGLGIELSRRLRQNNIPFELLLRRIDRERYLEKLAGTRLAILLPLKKEGFYLPGLEAMALGTPAIMTDCIGNREYSDNGRNCMILSEDEIVDVIMRLDSDALQRISIEGHNTANSFTLASESQMLNKILMELQFE